MSNPWPEPNLGGRGNPDSIAETDEEYIIRLLQQLFVEMAELRTLVASQESERP